MRNLFALAAMLVIATLIPSGVPAQDAKKATIEITDHGRLFSVLVNVDEGKKESQEILFHGGQKELSVEPGKHTIEVRHPGFPQFVRYQVWDGNQKLEETEQTVDPRQFDLKAGQKLRVLVSRPMEPYNGKFFELNVKGTKIPAGFIMTRPYWYLDIAKEWKDKPEEYPNSVFFLVDTKKWGPGKVFENLAEQVLNDLADEKKQPGDHRGKCHFSGLFQATPQGKVPEVFLKTDKEELKNSLAEQFLGAYEQYKKEKCYRPFPADVVGQMIKGGALSDETPQKRLHITFEQGLERAKIEYQRWLVRWGKVL